VVQPQEQPCFQAEGIQPVEAPNNEPQQPVTTYVPFHQIPIEQEKRRESQVASIGWFLTPQQLSEQQRSNA
jgi:hypothetical protein